LALAALEGGELPAARGVLVGVDVGPRPQRLEAGPAFRCDSVAFGAPSGPSLCLRGTTLQGYGPAGEALWERTFPEPPLLAGETTGEFFVWWTGSALIGLDPADGSTTVEVPLDPLLFPQSVVLGPTRDRALVGRGNHWFVVELHGSGWVPFAPCVDEAGALSALWGDGPILVLCSDGALAVGTESVGGISFESRPLPPGAGRSPLRIAPWGPDALVVTTHFGQAAVLDLATLEVRHSVELADHPLAGISPDFDQGIVALRGDRGDIAIWRPGGAVATLLPTRGRSAVFDEAGDLLILGSRRERWRFPPRPAPHRVLLRAGLSDVALAPDLDVAVGSRGDGHLSIWDLDSGGVRDVEVLPGAVLKDGTFAPDGDGFGVVAATDSILGVIWFDADWRRTSVRGGGNSRRVVTLADGRLIRINWGPGGPVLVGDAPGEEELVGWSGTFWDLAVSPSRARIVLAGGEDRVVGGELIDGKLVMWADAHIEGAHQVAVRDNGDLLVATKGGVMLLAPDGTERGRLLAGTGAPTALAVSPDGDLVALGDLSGGIWIWSSASGALLAELRAHDSRVSGLAFRSDGELISVSWDRTMHRWSLGSLRRSVGALKADLGPWALSVEEALNSFQ